MAILAELEPSRFPADHAARADLLARAGDGEAALAFYDRAIELTPNPTERRFLERQRQGCDTRDR